MENKRKPKISVYLKTLKEIQNVQIPNSENYQQQKNGKKSKCRRNYPEIIKKFSITYEIFRMPEKSERLKST